MSIFLFHFFSDLAKNSLYVSCLCLCILGLCVCMCVAGLWASKVGDAMS